MDFDDIKTANGGDSDAQTVLISWKSVAKIAWKIVFKIRKMGVTIANKYPNNYNDAIIPDQSYHVLQKKVADFW